MFGISLLPPVSGGGGVVVLLPQDWELTVICFVAVLVLPPLSVTVSSMT